MNQIARIAAQATLIAVASVPLGVVFGHDEGPSKPVEAEQVAAPRPSLVDSLVVANDCWVDEAPTGSIPGHVVVTTEAGVTRYAGRRVTEQALNQIFANEDHGLTVHAFCP